MAKADSGRETLIRQTFELQRDIEYHGFRKMYFEAHGAVSKYPDPADRENRMRTYWNHHMEAAYEQFQQTAMSISTKEVEAHYVTLQKTVALQGNNAWELFRDTPELIRREMQREALEKPPAERTAEERDRLRALLPSRSFEQTVVELVRQYAPEAAQKQTFEQSLAAQAGPPSPGTAPGQAPVAAREQDNGFEL